MNEKEESRLNQTFSYVVLDKVSISTILKTPTSMHATVIISFRDQFSGKKPNVSNN